jgi:Transposase IS4
MHYDAAIDVNSANKPEIIIHYNKTKSGVDNLDHLVGLYSCKRKTRRWPMTLFFNLVDCACVAAYVTWITKNPGWNQNNTRKRRLFLRGLFEELVEDHLQRRLENPQVMQAQVKVAFKALDFQTPMQAPMMFSDVFSPMSIFFVMRVLFQLQYRYAFSGCVQ